MPVEIWNIIGVAGSHESAYEAAMAERPDIEIVRLNGADLLKLMHEARVKAKKISLNEVIPQDIDDYLKSQVKP